MSFIIIILWTNRNERTYYGLTVRQIDGRKTRLFFCLWLVVIKFLLSQMSQPTTTNSDTVSSSSSWNQLQEDYNLRNGAKFSTEEQKANNNNNNNPAAAAAAAAAAANPPMIEDSNILPSLPSPTKKRKIILIIGVVLTIFDLCILPIIYFYVLTYHTSLTPQYGKCRSSPPSLLLVQRTSIYCLIYFGGAFF